MRLSCVCLIAAAIGGSAVAVATDQGKPAPEWRAVTDEGDEIAAKYGVRFIPGLMVVDGIGTVSYRREPTDLPPGKTIAEHW